MNLDDSAKLAGVIELLLASASRINEAKPCKYWYPLSFATYGTEEILEALDSLCSFRTTMWEKTLAFERSFAEYNGSPAAVMVNSGSSADLLMCFRLLDPAGPELARGAEVLMPVVTWPTQVWSAMMAGLTVRFVDVDPETLLVDLADLEQKIGPETRALFLVHLMGNPCPMDRIRALAADRLVILEDCCEALGAEFDGVKVGNFGAGGAFSFFFSHHITTMEGGMITCPDAKSADQLRILRAHGWRRNVESAAPPFDDDVDPRYAFVSWGFNVRPTDVQAGFGLRQLEKLPAFNRRRQELADRFFAFVDGSRFLTRPRIARGGTPAWFALPLMVRADAPFTRSELTAHLEEQGVETRPIVAGNLARQPVAKLFGEFQRDAFPGADAIHERGFYVGLSPLVADESLNRLMECLERFMGSR